MAHPSSSFLWKVDESGNVLVAGQTTGSLDGNTNAGGFGAKVRQNGEECNQF
jgi:hypothetical protein